MLPDLTGEWLWKEDSIAFDSIETKQVVRQLSTYRIRFVPVEDPPLKKNKKYAFYTLDYLDGPFAGFPCLVILYRKGEEFVVQAAESVDTGLTTVTVKSIDNHQAMRLEGVYQESGYIQDLFSKQAPKVAYCVFDRVDES